MIAADHLGRGGHRDVIHHTAAGMRADGWPVDLVRTAQPLELRSRTTPFTGNVVIGDSVRRNVRRSLVVVCLLGIAIVAVIVTGAALLLRGGISARIEPTHLELRLARALRTWGIPPGARAATNPIAASPSVLAAGLEHFADHCAICHGNDGAGRTAMGRSLYPRAPDMRRPETQTLTDGELFYIIENGIRFTGMPAWGGAGASEGSWHLVHFIRHLPTLTGEERNRMESLNPKSPDEWRALEAEDSFLRGEAIPSHEAGH